MNVTTAQSLEAAIDAYHKRPDVLYGEPNYRLHALGVPNDPRWADLWNLGNTGQEGGQVDADIDAPEAWDLARGSRDVVVVVIDTGIDYRHADLAANVWSNPADCDGDGRDDDGNGWVDDCHGIDTVNGDSDPLDDYGHGTHVAGTIGAVGDNGVGVTGVNQAVSIAKVPRCRRVRLHGRRHRLPRLGGGSARPGGPRGGYEQRLGWWRVLARAGRGHRGAAAARRTVHRRGRQTTAATSICSPSTRRRTTARTSPWP